MAVRGDPIPSLSVLCVCSERKKKGSNKLLRKRIKKKKKTSQEGKKRLAGNKRRKWRGIDQWIKDYVLSSFDWRRMRNFFFFFLLSRKYEMEKGRRNGFGLEK